MQRVEVLMDLAQDDVQVLGELAVRKRCTIKDMIEEAVAVFAASQRERMTRRTDGE